MTFYAYRDYRGEWRWYLKMNAGYRVTKSTEAYPTGNDCLAAIAPLQVNIRSEVVLLDGTYLVV